MALHKTIDKCPESSNIGMCSIYMFPSKIEKFLSLKTKIDKKELLFHFIFENHVVKSDELEEFFHDSFSASIEIISTCIPLGNVCNNEVVT